MYMYVVYYTQVQNILPVMCDTYDLHFATRD